MKSSHPSPSSRLVFSPKRLCLIAVATALLTLMGCGSTKQNTTAESTPPTPPAVEAPTYRGVFSGRLLRGDTQTPVPGEYVTFQSDDHYASGATDGYGRFRFENLPPGRYTLRFYNEGYATTEFGPYVVDKDQEVAGIVVQAKPLDPQLSPYTYSDVYLPNENVEINVRSIGVTEIQVDIYRIGAELLRGSLSKAIDRKQLRPDKLESILSYNQPVTAGQKLVWRTTPVKPAFEQPGGYVVRVRGGVSDILMPVTVTRLALITKRSPSAIHVWATDLITGEPIPGVPIVAERAGIGETATGMDGLATLAVQQPTEVQRIWGFAGIGPAYVDTVPASELATAQERAYVIVDRPLYRPGHTLFYKVIARRDDGGVYRVQPGKEWTVALRNNEGQTIAESTGVTNRWGTFSGQFELPEDGALGNWSVAVDSDSASAFAEFEVEEYRKPEFSLQVRADSQTAVFGGDLRFTVQGRYLFGAPLAGVKVAYTIYEEPYFPWRSSYWGDSASMDVSEDEEEYGGYFGYGRALTTGTVQLDAQGKTILETAVPPSTFDRRVIVEVTATEASGREVASRTSMVVTAGTFSLAVNAKGYVFKAGEDIPIEVTTRNTDGKPISERVKVTTSIETYVEKHKLWIYKPLDTRTVTTDANGKAEYKIKSSVPGYVRLDALATDERGNKIADTRFLWVASVAGAGGWQKKKSMELVLDKRTYAPGDTARILLNTQAKDAYALFTLEDPKGVRTVRIAQVSGSSKLFEVPLTDLDAPNVYVSAVLVKERSLYQATRSVLVSPQSRLLNVHLSADKPTYAPREQATFTLKVTGPNGKGVPAEASLALVDEAIFQLRSDNLTPIDAHFYGERPNVVTTSHSFPNRYLGGADKSGPPNVRSNFKDTAYWNAHVETDADGVATVTVPMPDNLTTWRLTARVASGNDKDKTLVGQTTTTIVTAKDLVARLLPPRFLMAGDQILLPGMIHNLGEDAAVVQTTLTTSGPATVTGPNQQALTLKSGDAGDVRWPLSIVEPGTVSLTLAAKTDKLDDAMTLDVSAYAVSVPRTDGVSGVLQQSGQARFVVPTSGVAKTATLNLTFTPSLVGLALESMETLARFPYGCVEQTLNAFLPDVVLQLALTDLGRKDARLEKTLPLMVSKGLSRLQRMQSDDGGWGWWSGDTSDPYLTSLVVYGLLLAGQGGFDVDQDALDRGLQRLTSFLDEGGFGDEARANLLFTLAHSPSHQDFVRDALPYFGTIAPKLSTHALASLILAAYATGHDAGAGWADHLITRAVRTGDEALFAATASKSGWVDNGYETTAMALRAVLSRDPKHPIVTPVIQYLVRQRRGGMWDTTKDTAQVIIALADVLLKTGEASSTYKATVKLDGKQVATLDVQPGSTIRESIAMGPADLAPGDHTLDVQIDGVGTFYWSGALTYGISPTPRSNGIRVQRTYRRVSVDALADGTFKETLHPIGVEGIQSGDRVQVDVTLEADNEVPFVIVEDPLASGAEVLPGTFANPAGTGGWPYWASHFEVRDQKVAVFARTLPKGKSELSYRIAMEVPGQVTASPAVARNMYVPDINGNSAETTLVIHPR